MPKPKKRKNSTANAATQSTPSSEAMGESLVEKGAEDSSPEQGTEDLPDESEVEPSQAEKSSKSSKAPSKAKKSKAKAKDKKSKDGPSEVSTTRVLRAGEAPKLSARSSGPIGYELGEDADIGEVKLRLVHNEGGGTFSKEWVPLARIAEAVAEPDAAGRSFHATRLRPAFNGRSTNNAPFLAAALVAEGLLSKSDEDGRKVMLRVARAPESWPAFLRQGKSKAKSDREKSGETEPEAASEPNMDGEEDDG